MLGARSYSEEDLFNVEADLRRRQRREDVEEGPLGDLENRDTQWGSGDRYTQLGRRSESSAEEIQSYNNDYCTSSLSIDSKSDRKQYGLGHFRLAHHRKTSKSCLTLVLLIFGSQAAIAPRPDVHLIINTMLHSRVLLHSKKARA